MIGLGDLQRRGPVAVVFGQPGDLVVEDVRESLQEEQGKKKVLELGGVLFATDGAGGVPKHLFHGFGRRCRWRCSGRPASGNLGRRCRCVSLTSLHADFPRQFQNRLLGGSLGLRRAALPAVHRGEGDAEAIGELLLREVLRRPDRAQDRRKVVFECHVCHICVIANICQEPFEPIGKNRHQGAACRDRSLRASTIF